MYRPVRNARSKYSYFEKIKIFLSIRKMPKIGDILGVQVQILDGLKAILEDTSFNFTTELQNFLNSIGLLTTEMRTFFEVLKSLKTQDFTGLKSKIDSFIQRIKDATEDLRGLSGSSVELPTDLRNLEISLNDLEEKLKELKNSGKIDISNELEPLLKEVQKLQEEIDTLEEQKQREAKEAAEERQRLEKQLELLQKEAEEAEQKRQEAEQKRREAELKRQQQQEAAEKAAKEEARRKAAEKKAEEVMDPILKSKYVFLNKIKELKLNNTVESDKSSDYYFKYDNTGIQYNKKNEGLLYTTLYTIPTSVINKLRSQSINLSNDLDDKQQINKWYNILYGIGSVIIRLGGPPAKNKLIESNGRNIKLVEQCNNKQDYGPFPEIVDNKGNEDVKKIVKNNIKGETSNLAFFSYGPSGSGKTYTLLGDKFSKGFDSGKYGIVNLLLQDPEMKYKQIKARAIQWYNGSIYPAQGYGSVKYKVQSENVDDKDKQKIVHKPKIEFNKPSLTSNNIKLFIDDINKKIKNTDKIISYSQLVEKYIIPYIINKKDKKENLSKIEDTILNNKRGEDQFFNFFFPEGGGPFKKSPNENLLQKIVDNLGYYEISVESFDSFLDNKKIINNDDNPFDGVNPVILTNEKDINIYIKEVMESRPTRATPRNKDSSRSHLFIEFEIEHDNNKKQKMYICDLGGIEEPLEYFGKAMEEGYWIVLGIYFIGKMIENYNNYIPMELSPGSCKSIRDYLFVNRNKIINDFCFPYLFLQNNCNYTNSDQISILDVNRFFKNLYSIMKIVLNLKSLSDFIDAKNKNVDIDNITQITSFINLKKQIDDDIFKNDLSLANNCKAASDSLIFAYKLLKMPTEELKSSFGIRHRRSNPKKQRRRRRSNTKKQRRRSILKLLKKPIDEELMETPRRPRSYRKSPRTLRSTNLRSYKKQQQ